MAEIVSVDDQNSDDALSPKDKVPLSPIARLASMPLVRQVGLMVGLAASVALGVGIVLWSQGTDYGLLYGSLAQDDAVQVIQALDQAAIPYKINQATGAIQVPRSQIHDARLKLAEQGLPKSAGVGYEMLDKEQPFGTTQFMEQARYHRALEGELARTVSAMASVKAARVHLAIPKQSIFIRRRQQPTASVIVSLYPGRTLQPGQVDAISHMVASSIPMLESNRVTVVDQAGRLLTSPNRDRTMDLSNQQFDYTRKLEESFIQRIEDILFPILGADRVRAQVTADMDFTITEQTQEAFNADQPALRSESTIEENNGGGGASGIPGTLSNQPVSAGTTNPDEAQAGGVDGLSGNSSRQATRNYELDKSISHTRSTTGKVRRLSVAVVVDDKVGIDAEGNLTRTALTDDEIARLTGLVREAVGFDPRRGDSVNVVNTRFDSTDLTPAPEVPIWEQPWFIELAKQGLGLLAVLALIFGVLRPFMRVVLGKPKEEKSASDPEALGSAAPGTLALPPGQGGEGGTAALPGAIGEDQVSLSGSGDQENPGLGPNADDASKSKEYEAQMMVAQKLVDDDPKLVAQVLRRWLNEGQ